MMKEGDLEGGGQRAGRICRPDSKEYIDSLMKRIDEATWWGPMKHLCESDHIGVLLTLHAVPHKTPTWDAVSNRHSRDHPGMNEDDRDRAAREEENTQHQDDDPEDP